MNVERLTPEQERLVTAHERLVRPIALAMARRQAARADVDELLGSGRLGLVEAALKFDERRGTDFKEYAAFHIRFAVLKALRKETTHERRVRLLAQQVGYSVAADRYREGNPLVDTEEDLEMRLDGAIDRLLGCMVAGGALGSAATVDAAAPPSEWSEIVGAVRSGLAEWEEKAQRAIEMLYFEDRTYEAAAVRLGITVMVLRRVERDVLEWMAKRLRALGFTSGLR